MATAPTVSFMQPTDPGSYAAQIQLQRQQAIADALLQQSQQPLSADLPQNLRVVPRMGVAGGMLKLAQALMANKLESNVTDKRAALAQQQMAQMAGLFGGQGDAQPTPPQAAPFQQAQAAMAQPGQGMALGPTNAAAAMAPPTPPQQAQQPQAAPMLIPGMDAQAAWRFYMTDPGKYLETLAQSGMPTDLQKTARAAGYVAGSPEYQRLMQGSVEKQNYITPPSIRPGGGIQNPRTGVITTMPTQAPVGFQNQQQPDGSWATIPTQGGTNAITASTAASEAGKAPFQLVDTFSGETGIPGKNYAGNTLQAPQIPGVTPQPAQGAQQPAEFDLHGSLQQQSQILADIARNGPNQAVRAAATARLQQMHSIGTGQPSAPAAPSGGANGVQTGPSLGQAQGATNAQNELSASWGAQQQAHAAAQTNIGLLQQVKGLSDKAITGYEADHRQYVARLGAYLGVPGMDEKASSSDLLGKFSAQLIGTLAQKGGMSTDAAREIVLAGTPNSHMQPQAIKEAVDGLVAREQMTQARTQALQPFAAKRDPQGFQNAASSFDQIADPRLWQMRGMTLQQLQRYTGSLSPNDAAQLVQKYVVAKQSGYLQ